MQPHEERVVAERDDLDQKIGKLVDFIGSSKIYKSLPEQEQSRLQVQLHYMQGYSHILHERVKNFPAQKSHLETLYTCPKCGKISHHPEDLKHRYCAWCHEFEHLERL